MFFAARAADLNYGGPRYVKPRSRILTPPL
jgi:hypothetical protein